MDVAIIGSGIIGLMSALTLTDAGFNVIIIARDIPGDDNKNWASPWAGAAIFPHPGASGQDLQVETFKYFWALAHKDPESGVQIVKATEFYDDRDDDSSIWYKHIVQRYQRIPYEDLPEKAKIGIQYETMTVNPEQFLSWLKNELQSRGVRFIQQDVGHIEAVKDATGCKAVVNASGLGASNLAGDNSVLPVRGQTMLVKTDFNELMMWQGSHYTYVIPRMYTGGVIVGGVIQEGSFDQEVDKDLRVDILKRVKMLAGGSLDAVDLTRDVQMDIVAFRPARRGGYRLEVERDVVHAYGFEGLGYTYCYGAALEVRNLVQLLRGGKVSPKSRL